MQFILSLLNYFFRGTRHYFFFAFWGGGGEGTHSMPRARVVIILICFDLLPLQGVYRKVAFLNARKCGQIMSIEAIRFNSL